MKSNEPRETVTDAEIREAANAYNRAYMREWRKKNPDKVRANQRRYWTKKALEAKRAAEQSEGGVTDGNEHDTLEAYLRRRRESDKRKDGESDGK